VRATAENDDTPTQIEGPAEVDQSTEPISPSISSINGLNGASNGSNCNSNGTNGAGNGSTTITTDGTTPAASTPPKPAGWNGLSIWLTDESLEGQQGITKALHAIRKDFMSEFKPSAKDSGIEASVNGNGVKTKPKVTSEDPSALHQAILRDTVKYGEMVQAVYDTLQTKNVYRQNFGNCMEDAMLQGQKLGDEEVLQYTQLGDEAKEYKVLTRLQADSGAYKLVVKKDRNYIGFIAEGPEDADKAVDIAIVFRGTITRDEWVQDAKALKVRWRNGEQVVSPPNILLSASPFKGDVRVALSAFVGTLVLLSSTYGERAVAGVTSALSELSAFCLDAGGASAAVCLVLQTIIEAFAGSFNHAAAVMQHVFTTLQVDPAQVPLLSHSAVAGATAWVMWGIFAGLFEKPEDWLENTWKLLTAVRPWMWFGIISLADSLFGLPWNDPRVSYGFKEMYCDALPKSECESKPCPNTHADANGKLATGNGNGVAGAAAAAAAAAGNGTSGTALHESPRLTIIKTLVGLLKQGKKIKSITITGHSLGAALASMCGFDLSTALTEALKLQERQASNSETEQGREQLPAKLAALLSQTISEGAEQLKAAAPDVVGNAASGLVEACTGTGDLLGLYKETDKQRSTLVSQLAKLPKGQLPAVAVVSFAGPRVGDLNYSNAFIGRSIMCPMGVLEPILDGSYRPGVWNKFQGFMRDSLVQVSKMPWYAVGLLQLAWKRDRRGPQPPAGARVGMLRIVNAHDVVPNLPFTLPLPPFMYVHGGHELLLNSYLVTYFKNGLLGPSVGARHNLEMYLHLLDSSRDEALVNKTDDVLVPDKKVPADWWRPLKNKGMIWDEKDKKWKSPK